MSNVITMEKSNEAKPEASPVTFKIMATLEGFPVEVQMEGKADNLKALVERLKQIGAQPPALIATQAASASKPVCPIHGTPMKASRKPGYSTARGRPMRAIATRRCRGSTLNKVDV
jgi:hypothetical protein